MFNLTQLFVKSFLGGTYNKTILKESTQNPSPTIARTNLNHLCVMGHQRLQETSFRETFCLRTAAKLLDLSRRLHWSGCGTHLLCLCYFLDGPPTFHLPRLLISIHSLVPLGFFPVQPPISDPILLSPPLSHRGPSLSPSHMFNSFPLLGRVDKFGLGDSVDLGGV